MMQTVVMLCLKLEQVSIVNKIIKLIMCWITNAGGQEAALFTDEMFHLYQR